jgi:UDP-N-acetylmuramoyl-tripeptide--D-alanyl-D-alanine ligase
MEVLTISNDIRIINDTYNANPGSMSAALETLVKVKDQGRGIAALGDMLELGPESAALHREVGRVAGQVGIDFLLAMGEHGHDLLTGGAEAGMEDERLILARNYQEMALHLSRLLVPGDWVLVKGSRGMRMEKVVEELVRITGNTGESAA